MVSQRREEPARLFGEHLPPIRNFSVEIPTSREVGTTGEVTPDSNLPLPTRFGPGARSEKL